jgi:Ca-activated chloride channel homolog
MKLLPEDPRLTAYALGEIEDQQERSAIESAVAQSPELQQAVAAIRDMRELLTKGFAAEPIPELSEFEKARMGQPTATRERSGVSRLLSWPVLSSVAAVLIIAFVVLPQRSALKEDFAYQAEPRREDFADQALPIELLISKFQIAERIPAPDVEIHAELIENSPFQSIARPDVKPNEFVESARSVTALRVAEKQMASRVLMRKRVVLPKEADRYVSVTATNAMVLSAPEKLAPPKKPKASVSAPAPPAMNLAAHAMRAPSQARELPATFNTEKYAPIEESGFRSPLVAALSTFSIDVDTASYANVRRFLNQGQLPPADALRIEELINYFPYADAAPTKSLDEGGAPFAVHMAQTIAPWNESHHLLRVALKGYEMPWEERPSSNLVFLLDVSGSMSNANKLPLVKEAMDLLVRRLDGRDRVAVVVYAGASGLALPSTTANNHDTIQHAMDNLKAGGSTNGGAGIQLAYKVAREHFIEGGNNRVILCTDGDFNVGQTNSGDLTDIAEAAADEGISLTILGFGMGNYKDDLLEELSNKGKGTYAYVDSSAEARKVFLEDLTGNLFKIAKDVKIQVEFNPAQVNAYRLIGYENRRLKAEDFNNDKKKAGDIGPGHTVVALYEIIPATVDSDVPSVDALRYQEVEAKSAPGEVATVKLRYKQPDADVSQLITRTVNSDELVRFAETHEDVRFSAIVAAFGMRLAGSEHLNGLSYNAIESIAASSLGIDPGGHRSEFVGLVRRARQLSTADAPMPVQSHGTSEE